MSLTNRGGAGEFASPPRAPSKGWKYTVGYWPLSTVVFNILRSTYCVVQLAIFLDGDGLFFPVKGRVIFRISVFVLLEVRC